MIFIWASSFELSAASNPTHVTHFSRSPVKPMRVRNPDARDGLADDFLRSSGADIREGHGEALYVPSRDFISMPAFAGFKGADHFYNVAFHELTHYADLRIMPRRCVFLRTGAQFRRGMSA